MKRREPRNELLRVRYTPEEKERIEQAAAEIGLMTSEFVRMAVDHAVKSGIKIPKLVAPKGQGQVAMSN